MSRFFKYCILASAITLVSFLLTQFIRYDITGLPAFSSADKTVDFEFSDLYASVADGRPVSHYSEDVCVVGIDGLDRQGIADVIQAVNYLGARTIGVDLFFLWPDGGGDFVESALRDLGDRVVLPKDTYGKKSYFYDSFQDSRYGFINLVASTSHEVVRRYRGGNSMAAVLVGAEVSVSEGESTLIPFHSVVIDTLSSNMLMDAEGFPREEASNLVEGRTVLIGTLHDPSDWHLTPVNAEMPGVLIHAIMTDSFMSGRSMRETGKGTMLLIAIIYTWIFALMLLLAKHHWDNVGNLAIRVFQFLTILIMFRIGCHYYMNEQLYIDFSEAILMTVFASISFDLSYGVYALILKIRKK